MNLITTLAESRYLLYLEDDWLALPEGHHGEDEGEHAGFVDDALAVIEHSRAGVWRLYACVYMCHPDSVVYMRVYT
jgi:hypothetical protein